MSLCPEMAELELTRTPNDRRLYVLEGVGTLRSEGLGSHAATADADGVRWRLGRRRWWHSDIQATDATGAVVGEFEPRTIRRGGALHWLGHELSLRPASAWRERYALVDGDRELAILDGKGWGRRPVKISLRDLGAVEPGLLLFATFVVRGLADDAGAAAGASGATSTAATG